MKHCLENFPGNLAGDGQRRTARGAGVLLAENARAGELALCARRMGAQQAVRLGLEAEPAGRRSGGQRWQPDPGRHRQNALCPEVRRVSFYRQHEVSSSCCILQPRLYGIEEGRNDEAMLLEENLPDVPHLQDRDRVALAATAVEELESEVLVLDDGFQHRRLARDLDIVLIEGAGNPWGFGRSVSSGRPLREPFDAATAASRSVMIAGRIALLTARRSLLRFANGYADFADGSGIGDHSARAD